VAVTVRRLHDIDRAGWWVLAFAIPLVIAGAFGASLGTMNFQSASPAIMIVLAITIIAFVIGGMALLVFAVTRGTEGTNRYGPDPYGPDQLEEVFA
jgi:uncharacterized membrane protein YhaH (DUF805 family)